MPYEESGRRKVYCCWKDMKRRCFNKKAPCYENYGGRGISICKQWLDFECFLRWALASGFERGLTIDRIDNDGDYCAENCQWITNSENVKKQADWAKKNGQYKLSIEDASKAKKLAFSGTVSDKEIAGMFGVTVQMIGNIARGRAWQELEPVNAVRERRITKYAKLSDEDRWKIETLVMLGCDRHSDIAEVFGVSRSMVSSISSKLQLTEQSV